jgi:hypothetical protein
MHYCYYLHIDMFFPFVYAGKNIYTSRVLAVLLRENLTNAYIFSDLSFPKAFHRLDHSIRIVEYHRKELSLNPTSSPGLETRTVVGFVTLDPLISSPKKIAFAPLYCA